MKFLFIILLTLLFPYTGISQKSFGQWRISATGVFQIHDTRLFGFSNADEFIKNEKDLGTSRFEFILHKSIFLGSGAALYIGLGYSRETAQFSRRFDEYYFGYENMYLELFYLGRYNISVVEIPIDYCRNFNGKLSKWYVSFKLNTQLSFCKNMETTRGQIFPPKHLTEFYALELTPGIGRHFKKWDIGIHWRVFQMKQVDKAIFSKNIFTSQNVPLLDKPFDIYNPLHIALSLGYSFGK